MGALKASVLGLLLLAASPAAAEPVDRWRSLIVEASARFGVPERWITRVMRAESAGRTTLGGRPITSPAGAMGLMQLMPGTWATMRARLGLGADPHDPRDNILAGTFYLRLMYERFGYPGLFAAYNAGPGRYAAHLANGRRLPAETVAYVAAVGGAASSRSVAPRDRAQTGGIFVALGSAGRVDAAAESAPTTVPPASRDLFVRLATPSNSAD
jgi:soluble lytic murein transglycosylase-like protein